MHWQVCSCHQYCEHNQNIRCEKRKLQGEFFPSVTHRNASRWQPTFYKKLDQKLCSIHVVQLHCSWLACHWACHEVRLYALPRLSTGRKTLEQSATLRETCQCEATHLT